MTVSIVVWLRHGCEVSGVTLTPSVRILTSLLQGWRTAGKGIIPTSSAALEDSHRAFRLTLPLSFCIVMLQAFCRGGAMQIRHDIAAMFCDCLRL